MVESSGTGEFGSTGRSDRCTQSSRPLKESSMPRTRVHNLNVSLDGYAAGEQVTFDAPIGGAERLFGCFDGRAIHGVDGVDAPVTLDRALTSLWGQGIGAEIMGRRKFGPQVGDWPDDGWRGWWGDEPPFRTPVFVLSHYPHPTIDFANGTSFRFVDGSARGGPPAGPGSRRWWGRAHRRGTLDGAPVPRGRPGRLHAPGDRADRSRAGQLPLGRITPASRTASPSSPSPRRVV